MENKIYNVRMYASFSYEYNIHCANVIKQLPNTKVYDPQT